MFTDGNESNLTESIQVDSSHGFRDPGRSKSLSEDQKINMDANNSFILELLPNKIVKNGINYFVLLKLEANI